VENGNPSNRYIEVATVTYDDGSGSDIPVGTYSGNSINQANVSITGDVVSITVTLEDGYDGNSSQTLSINLSSVSSCDTGGECPDDDGDGVCNSEDICPGFDDGIDTDGDGIPDGCDSGDCTTTSDEFPLNPLTDPGTGSSSTTLAYSATRQDVSFTISGLDAVTNGNPNNRYIEEAVVTYDDGINSGLPAGTYSGANGSSADVSISGDVVSVTVTLLDGYDGSAPQSLSIDFSSVSSCIPAAALQPSSDKDLGDEWATIRGDLNLFPNPVGNALTVQFDLVQDTEVTLQVTNVNGQSIMVDRQFLKSGVHNERIDVSQIPDGIYFLHFLSDGQPMTKKFVVVH
jgi:hypothetical protein